MSGKPSTVLFKNNRYRLFHKPSRQLVELSANDMAQALAKLGWGSEETIVVHLGYLPVLLKTKRYVSDSLH